MFASVLTRIKTAFLKVRGSLPEIKIDLGSAEKKAKEEYAHARAKVLKAFNEDLVITLETEGGQSAILKAASQLPEPKESKTFQRLPKPGTDGNPYPEKPSANVKEGMHAGLKYAAGAVASIQTAAGPGVDAYDYAEINSTNPSQLQQELAAKIAEGWSTTGPLHSVWLNDPSDSTKGTWSKGYGIRKLRASK